ncbi:hypothetical protein GQ457_01G031970 [Hibiscus cannabinus]
MLVQGKPADGGTGPLGIDSKLGTIVLNNGSLNCRGLIAAPNSAVNERKKDGKHKQCSYFRPLLWCLRNVGRLSPRIQQLDDLATVAHLHRS